MDFLDRLANSLIFGGFLSLILLVLMLANVTGDFTLHYFLIASGLYIGTFTGAEYVEDILKNERALNFIWIFSMLMAGCVYLHSTI